MNFTNKGDSILKIPARNKRMIIYKNLFFKAGNLGIKTFDFLKTFGTLFDSLIDLINGKIVINEAKQEQGEMIDKIDMIEGFILLEERSIKKKKK